MVQYVFCVRQYPLFKDPAKDKAFSLKMRCLKHAFKMLCLELSGQESNIAWLSMTFKMCGMEGHGQPCNIIFLSLKLSYVDW